MELEHSYIETNGIRLHVVQAGPKSGTPVLFLHGFPENWRCWIRQLPALAQAGCRVIIPDQRGYNLSDKPSGIKNYRMEELTQDILGLINALDYEKVNLVGHDFGAVVAWSLGIQNPERLHRLSVLNVPHPAVMQRFLRRDFEQLRRSWYIFFFQLPWIPEAGMRFQNWRRMVHALQDSGKANTFTADDLTSYKEAWSQPGAITAMLNWYRAAARYPLLDSERDICVRIPTLMMWGMHDVALTHRMARPSMDYCKDGRLLFFPEATHWVQRDEADEVNRHLLEFIIA